MKRRLYFELCRPLALDTDVRRAVVLMGPRRAALEIKWGNRFYENPSDLKSLVQFCEENRLEEALVTTIDKEGIKEHRNVSATFRQRLTLIQSAGIRSG